MIIGVLLRKKRSLGSPRLFASVSHHSAFGEWLTIVTAVQFLINVLCLSWLTYAPLKWAYALEKSFQRWIKVFLCETVHSLEEGSLILMNTFSCS